MYSAYSYCYTCPNIVLVGNKSDLEAEREIQWQDGEKMANAFDIPFIEISAKTGEHIDKVYLLLTSAGAHDVISGMVIIHTAYLEPLVICSYPLSSIFSLL